MQAVIFRSVRWESEGWTKRYIATAVPRRGDLVNLDGDPYTVQDVAWCYDKDDSDVVVYVEVVAHVPRRSATEGGEE